MSTETGPYTRVQGEAKYPGDGIQGSIWILEQVTEFCQNICIVAQVL